MPTAQLAPFNEEIVGPNPYKPSAIVGANAWSDISTANYTENWLSSRAPILVQPWASATFAPVDIPDDGVLTSMDFTAIVALANEGVTGTKWVLILADMAYNEVAYVGADGNDYITAPAADSEWYTMDFLGGVIPGPSWLSLQDSNPIPAGEITDLLRDGFRVGVYRLSGVDDVSPFDAMLRCAYLVGVCSWTTGAIPPLRRTQRDDLRNTGRGSRQRSLRNTGYL